VELKLTPDQDNGRAIRAAACGTRSGGKQPSGTSPSHAVPLSAFLITNKKKKTPAAFIQTLTRTMWVECQAEQTERNSHDHLLKKDGQHKNV